MVNRFNFLQVFKGHPTMIFALAPAGGKAFYSGDSSGNLIRWEIGKPDGEQIARLSESILKILPDPADPNLVWCTTLKGHLVCIDLHLKKYSSYAVLQGGILDLNIHGEDIYFSGDKGLLSHCKKDRYYTIDSIQLAHRRVRCLLDKDSYFIAGNSEGRIVQVNKDPLDLMQATQIVHTGSVLALAHHSTGFFSCGSDGQIIRWSDNLQPLQQISAHNSAVYRLLPVPSSGLLFSASRDGSIRIWDLTSIELIRSIDKFYHEGHYRSVNDLMWLPESQVLISCSDDREIRCWQFE